MKAWIDKVGLAPEDVIIVDVKGDLPYAQGSLGALRIAMEPLTGVMELSQDNAYNDYRSNSNNKYTYVRI
ncbi:MAG: hypothetical protein ABH873_01710, partial [Candidatus Firestonebacteria bacterium]